MQQITTNSIWAIFALLNDTKAMTALFNISKGASHG